MAEDDLEDPTQPSAEASSNNTRIRPRSRPSFFRSQTACSCGRLGGSYGYR